MTYFSDFCEPDSETPTSDNITDNQLVRGIQSKSTWAWGHNPPVRAVGVKAHHETGGLGGGAP